MSVEDILAKVNANLAAQDRANAIGQGELPGLRPLEPVGLGDVLNAPSMLARTLEALRLTYEPLRRVTQASREAILWAGARVPRETFRHRVSLAFSGKAEMGSREFTHLLFGHETWQRMERTPLIPGWLPAIAHPEQAFLQRLKRGQVSLGDLATLGAEIFADPFSVAALTPEGAGLKVAGKLGPVGRVITAPYYRSMRALDSIIGPRSNGPLATLHLGRQMEDVFTGPQRLIYEEFVEAKDVRMAKGLQDYLGRLTDLTKGKLKRKDLTDQRIGAWLRGKKIDLSQDELVLARQLDDLAREQAQKIAGETGKKVSSQLSLFPEGPTTKPFMAQYVPRELLGKRIPVDIWQSWRIEDLGHVTLGFKRGDVVADVADIAKQVEELPLTSFSALDTVGNFTYAAQKKLHLEPVMLKWAPKGRGQAMAENPLIRNKEFSGGQASRWQRRYITDVINQLTGSGRGRKMIEFDNSMGDFYQRFSGTPMGRRIVGLFEKLGYGRTLDGLPDFSPTTKLAGLLTHSIAINALGGRLRSAVVNATQISNYALVRGIPSTIKGMLHFVPTPGNVTRMLRKEADLMASYHDLWQEDLWIKTLGTRLSNALMAPFNAAENIIRGTGFNVGLDTFARQNKLTLKEIAQSPELTQRAIRFARFESLNGAFIYGTLGRPPFLSNPLLRPYTSLLSYPFKQAEFLRRTFVNDGSALMRFIGLHGFMIEKANEWGGASAEDFLGWGFTPMARSFGGVDFLLTSPPMRVLKSTVQGLIAAGEGDPKQAEAHFKEVKETIPLLSPVPFPWLAIRDITGNPATGKQGLIDMWRTGQQKLGDSVVPIMREDILTNWLVGRTTIQRQRADLAARKARASRKFDHIMDQRAKRYVKVAHGHSGDDLGKAAWDLSQPVNIEGLMVYPTPEQIQARVSRRLKQAYVSKDVLAMQDNQFLTRVFLWAQLELLHDVAERKQ